MWIDRLGTDKPDDGSRAIHQARSRWPVAIASGSGRGRLKAKEDGLLIACCCALSPSPLPLPSDKGDVWIDSEARPSTN
jgi:hypothetical protein